MDPALAERLAELRRELYVDHRLIADEALGILELEALLQRLNGTPAQRALADAERQLTAARAECVQVRNYDENEILILLFL